MPEVDPLARWLKENPGRSVRGLVPQWIEDGLRMVPWWESFEAKHGKDADRVPAHIRKRVEAEQRKEEQEARNAFEEMKAKLPPVKPTTARERVGALTERLVGEAKRTQERYGYPILPRSVVEEICRIYGNDLRLTPEKLTRMTLEKLRPILRRYGEAKQRKADNEYRKDRSPEVESAED